MNLLQKTFITGTFCSSFAFSGLALASQLECIAERITGFGVNEGGEFLVSASGRFQALGDDGNLVWKEFRFETVTLCNKDVESGYSMGPEACQAAYADLRLANSTGKGVRMFFKDRQSCNFATWEVIPEFYHYHVFSQDF